MFFCVNLTLEKFYPTMYQFERKSLICTGELVKQLSIYALTCWPRINRCFDRRAPSWICESTKTSPHPPHQNHLNYKHKQSSNNIYTCLNWYSSISDCSALSWKLLLTPAFKQVISGPEEILRTNITISTP